MKYQMKALVSLFILAYSTVAFGQLNLSGIEKQSFLIGTLDDYMGHQQTFCASTDSSYFQLVDVYNQNQKDIALLIDSLFRNEHADLRMTNNGSPKGIRLYSRTLSAKVNSYYSYSPSQIRTTNGDTIYTGSIKSERISTELEKLSFLVGAFLMNGRKTDSNDYFLTIPNSVSKATLCEKLLNELNCRDVKHVVLNRIPIGHWITFKPSESVLNAIRKIEGLKKDKPFPAAVLTNIVTNMN